MNVNECIKSIVHKVEENTIEIEFVEDQTPEQVECIKTWIMELYKGMKQF